MDTVAGFWQRWTADAFRPMFFLTACAAALLAPLWLLVLAGQIPAPPGLHPVQWHAHEMLFGFGGALIVGFVLTAVRNWTGQASASAPELLALVLMWLAGRAMPWFEAAPSMLSATVVAGYFLFAALIVARPLLRGRNWRNIVFIPLLLWLAGLSAMVWLAPLGTALAALDMALYTIVALLVFMGGRVIPFFTERRLAHVSVTRLAWLDWSSTLTAAALIPAVLLADGVLRGSLFALAGMLVLVRMAGWEAWATWREPLLWVLHLGYLWLAVGLLYIAAGLLSGLWPASEGSHALVVGALGSLAIGMMARVSLGHSGRVLAVSGWMVPAFLLPSVAAILRLLAPFGVPLDWLTGMAVAALLWSLAFAIWLWRFVPVLHCGREA